MSIVNFRLQSIGLMRKEMSSEAEKALKNCNSLKQIRSAGEPFRQSIQQSIDLVTNVMSWLELKGEKNWSGNWMFWIWRRMFLGSSPTNWTSPFFWWHHKREDQRQGHTLLLLLPRCIVLQYGVRESQSLFLSALVYNLCTTCIESQYNVKNVTCGVLSCCVLKKKADCSATSYTTVHSWRCIILLWYIFGGHWLPFQLVITLHRCGDTIEQLYFSEDICIYCGTTSKLVGGLPDTVYPVCSKCKEAHEPIQKRKKASD